MFQAEEFCIFDKTLPVAEDILDGLLQHRLYSPRLELGFYFRQNISVKMNIINNNKKKIYVFMLTYNVYSCYVLKTLRITPVIHKTGDIALHLGWKQRI